MKWCRFSTKYFHLWFCAKCSIFAPSTKPKYGVMWDLPYNFIGWQRVLEPQLASTQVLSRTNFMVCGAPGLSKNMGSHPQKLLRITTQWQQSINQMGGRGLQSTGACEAAQMKPALLLTHPHQPPIRQNSAGHLLHAGRQDCCTYTICRLTLVTILGWRYSYLYVTDEDSGAERHWITCPRSSGGVRIWTQVSLPPQCITRIQFYHQQPFPCVLYWNTGWRGSTGRGVSSPARWRTDGAGAPLGAPPGNLHLWKLGQESRSKGTAFLIIQLVRLYFCMDPVCFQGPWYHFIFISYLC